jgi:hypothetical protein
MLYIRSLDLFILHIGCFVSFDLHIPTSYLIPDNYYFILYIYVFFFLDSTCKWDHAIFLSMSGIFLLVWCPPNLSMLCKWQDLLSKVEYYFTACTHYSFFIHLSINGHLDVFISCLLWIKLPWTWECRCFYVAVVNFP